MSSSVLRRGLFGGVLLAFALIGWQILKPPQPILLGTVSGEVSSLKMGSLGVLCLVRTSKPVQAQLVLIKTDDAKLTVLASAPDILGFTVNGTVLFFLEASGKLKGALKQIALSDPQTFRSDLRSPQDVLLEGNDLFWAEMYSPYKFWQKVPQLVGLTPRIGIKTMPLSGGMPHDVAVLAASGLQDRLRFLGSDGSSLYFLMQRSAGKGATLFYRVPKVGGAAELLASEPGLQTGLLVRDGLYYTGASEEASPMLSFASIKKISFADGKLETLTDWLPAMGGLGQDGSLVYYQAQNRIWQIPDRFGPVHEIVRFARSPSKAIIADGRLYVAVQGAAQGTDIIMYRRIPRLVRAFKS